ncbi:MAG: hypothetical protein K2Z81_04290, partial [Cyanobacteria bacterium]|nr:hypothetical protein [Cyanobacteriota bacterium]
MLRFTSDGPFELISGIPDQVGQAPQPFEAFCASLDILGFKDALDSFGSQGLGRAYGEALSLTNFALKRDANLVRE